jgi:hypothetical protein
MVLYDNEKLESVTIIAGRCDPKLRMPSLPLPELVESSATVHWLGQDGLNSDRPGDVHVAISGLASSSSIDGVVLSDGMRRMWVYRKGGSDAAVKSIEPGALPIQMKLGPGGKSADLFFTPYREAGGETFTLRLISQRGRSSLLRFKGERCELSRRTPIPSPSRVAARPGDDLQALVGSASRGSKQVGRSRTAGEALARGQRRDCKQHPPRGADRVFRRALETHRQRLSRLPAWFRFARGVRRAWDERPVDPGKSHVFAGP